MTIYLRDDEPITAAYLRQELEELLARIPVDESGNEYVLSELHDLEYDVNDLATRVDLLFDKVDNLADAYERLADALDSRE